jgi:hypothetical protein
MSNRNHEWVEKSSMQDNNHQRLREVVLQKSRVRLTGEKSCRLGAEIFHDSKYVGGAKQNAATFEAGV